MTVRDMPWELSLEVPGLFNGEPVKVMIYPGVTTLIGPNGSGKTKLMERLKVGDALGKYVGGTKFVRYLSADRLGGPLGEHRSDFYGNRLSKESRHSRVFFSLPDGDWPATESILGDLHVLSERPDLRIKLAETLRALFQREVYLEWKQGYLKPRFRRADGKGPKYPSPAEANGILHLMCLLTALYNDETKALLIDEPELAMHPQLQTFLLREFHKIAGDPSQPGRKVIIVATHSPLMVKMDSVDDLARLIFFTDSTTAPSQPLPDDGLLKGTDCKRFIRQLGQPGNKPILFSRRPLVVEGESDAIICSALDQHLDLNLGAGGSHVVPAKGKDALPPVVKLLRLMGKTPVILADLDAFVDNTRLGALFYDSGSAKQQALKLGHEDLQEFHKHVYDKFCKLADEYAKSSVDGPGGNCCSKECTRRGTMADLLQGFGEGIPSRLNGEGWKDLKARILLLLRVFESAGCFFLRRGSMEAYYEADRSSRDKIEAAAAQAEALAQMLREQVREQYDDIVRALEFAAQVPETGEHAALRQFILQHVTPILDTLETTTSDDDLNARLDPDAAKLLRLKNVSRERGAPTLTVEITSPVLDVPCGPFDLSPNDNPLQALKRCLPD